MTRDYTRSADFAQRLRALVPGGSHTYAKGPDQYPELSPNGITRGDGCRIWDLDGNEYLEYAPGLRAVTLGHAHPAVTAAASEWLVRGQNFNRPAQIELEAAEAFLAAYPAMEMVKFCKDGSAANDGAIRLARAVTGRDLVALPADQPFFSSSDWFIGSLVLDAGVPQKNRGDTVRFAYNDLASLDEVFATHPGQIAAVLMEPARIDEPAPGFLVGVQERCRREGAVLIFDEMVTGLRWDYPGAGHGYGVVPDLATFGKALGNGFAVSALTGKRELMELGGLDHQRERAWLLSTTHGGESHALAAAVAVLAVYRDQDVIGHLHQMGARLRAGFAEVSAAHGLDQFVTISGRDCALYFGTRDADGNPSQPYRTLFLQELLERGVLAPSLFVTLAHGPAEIDQTIDVVDGALGTYAKAIAAGSVDGLLRGRPVQPVYRRIP